MKPRSDGISNTVSTVQKDNLLIIEVIQVGQIYGTEREPNPQAGRIYDSSGISPCLDAMRGGNRMPKIIQPVDISGVMLDDGRLIKIRKLTPKECFRLQGWTDDYFDKAAFVNSDSQLYKQAGNGVTVNVVYEIARRMVDNEQHNTD